MPARAACSTASTSGCRRRPSTPRIDTKLDNAGLAIERGDLGAHQDRRGRRPGACILGLLLGNVLLGLIAGGLLGWFVSRHVAQLPPGRRRRKAFEEELPDFLMLIASALRSGLSFQQGLDSSAADGKGEVSRQMRRALREVQMGSLLEPALVRVADRMHSEDLRWTVLALGIQREVGGNLSNILETAASTDQGPRGTAPRGADALGGGQAVRLRARGAARRALPVHARRQPRVRLLLLDQRHRLRRARRAWPSSSSWASSGCANS